MADRQRLRGLVLGLVIAAMWAGASPGQTPASESPGKSQPRNNDERWALTVAWCRDQYVAHYRQSLKPGQPPSPEVEAALGLYADSRNSLGKDANRNLLLAMTRRGRQFAPDDPLLELATGDAWLARGELKPSGPMLERARQGLSAGRPFVRLKAAQRCQAHARQVGDKARVEALGKEIVQHLIALASDPACAGEHQRSYVSMTVSQVPGPPRWFIDELAKTSPPEWLRMVLDAQCHITEAWDARGRKTAEQVTPAGWRDFERHLREADELLRAAYALDPNFPEAATGMIAVATGLDQPAKEVRAWFDRAIAAHYDHHPAYRDFLWFSLPRWGGSHSRLLGLGQACLDAARFDTHVPTVFRQALQQIAFDHDDPARVYRQGDNLERLRRLHEGLMSRPRSRKERASLISTHVSELVLAGQAEEAARLYQSLDGDFDEQVLQAQRVQKDWLQKQLLPHLQPHVPKAMPTFDLFAAEPPPVRAIALVGLPVKDTSLQEHTRYCDWLAKNAVSDYAAKGGGDARDADAVKNVLRQWTTRLYEAADAPEERAILAEFERLAAAGCTDPLFGYAHARMLERAGKSEAAFAKLQESAAALQKRGYGDQWLFLCKRRLVALMRQKKLEAPAGALNKQALEHAVAMARAPLCRGDAAIFYVNTVLPPIVYGHDLGSLDERTVAAIAEDQAVDRWLRHFLLGLSHCVAVWRARLRSDRAEDGMFFANLDAATRELSAAHALRPEWPVAAALLIGVRARALDQDGVRTWFERAVAAQFDNHAAYGNMSEALRPEFGGSVGALRQFASECLATARFDTEVPAKLLNALQDLQDLVDHPRWVWASPTVAEEFERLVQGYEAQNAPLTTTLRRGRVHVAWAGGRYAEAVRHWEAGDRALDESWLRRLQADAATVKADLEAVAAATKR